MAQSELSGLPVGYIYKIEYPLCRVYSQNSVLFLQGNRQRCGQNLLLPPANEVWGKVIFFHLSVILFTRWWGSTCSGTPPGRYTPVGRFIPLAGTPPWAGTHPGQVDPAGRYTPPRQVHPPMVNVRAVRILLECILVLYF